MLEKQIESKVDAGMVSSLVDMAGKRFGRWKVLSFSGVTGKKSRHSMWLCRCDCGNEKVVDGSNLRTGKSVSCGCFRAEVSSNTHIRHGLYGTPLYSLWAEIKRRCYNKRLRSYAYWGGRGITMHDEWIDDPDAFIAWIKENLGDRPENHSIDRIDNDGNYEPNNLRWATAKQQANNRRNNINSEGL